MDKGDKAGLGPDTGFFVDKAGALRPQTVERGLDIIYLHRDVVDAGPAFFEEFRDRRIFARGFEQLNAAFANGKHCDADLLFLDGLRVNILEPQGVDPKPKGVVNTPCRDAEVVYLH